MLQETTDNFDDAVNLQTEPFVPKISDKFFGYFVGANYGDHYTRQDVNDITRFSSLTFASVGIATAGASYVLHVGLGVSPYFAALPLAALFTSLDRSFVRMEVVDRADARLQDKKDLYPNPHEPIKKWRGARKFFSRALPVALRMSVAASTTVITGNAIIEAAAQPEIAAMADAAVLHHNKPFVLLERQKEDAYEQRITLLKKSIDDAKAGILDNSINVAPAARLPADADNYRRAQAAYDALIPQVGQAQADLTTQNRAVLEEENGAKLPGRSGIPSCGTQCVIAKTKAAEARTYLDNLQQQQADQQKIMDGVAKKDAASVAEQKTIALKNTTDYKTNLAKNILDWTQELQQMSASEKAAFAGFKQQMISTPGYLSAKTQRGLFADMYLFEKYLDRPTTGPITTGTVYAFTLVLFLLEMSAVLGASIRPITPSEDQDAYIRSETRDEIKRKVRDGRKSEISEDREFFNATRPSGGYSTAGAEANL